MQGQWNTLYSLPGLSGRHAERRQRGSTAHERRPVEDKRRKAERPKGATFRRSAPGKIRTCDLCLRRAALYPLSYGRPGETV